MMAAPHLYTWRQGVLNLFHTPHIRVTGRPLPLRRHLWGSAPLPTTYPMLTKDRDNPQTARACFLCRFSFGGPRAPNVPVFRAASGRGGVGLLKNTPPALRPSVRIVCLPPPCCPSGRWGGGMVGSPILFSSQPQAQSAPARTSSACRAAGWEFCASPQLGLSRLWRGVLFVVVALPRKWFRPAVE